MSATRGPDRWLVLLTRSAIALVIGFIAVCALWRVQGGEWRRVESPSMGTRAPVGSLLWVRPVDFDSLQPGDFVTFHAPGAATTYSHLVLRRNADGTLTTKGVIPGPDPWRLSADDVVGEVAMTWRGVGWLVAAAPVLLVGGLAVAAVRSAVRRRWKAPATLVLGSLVVSVALVVVQPLTGAEQLGFVADPAGGADASYVGTGLLPIRLQVEGGPHVVLRAGEVGGVHVTSAGEDGRLTVQLSPEVPLWWWVALVLACFLPALAASLSDRLRRRRGSPGRA